MIVSTATRKDRQWNATGDEVHLNETEATGGVKSQGVRYRPRHFAAADRHRHVGGVDPGLGAALGAPLTDAAASQARPQPRTRFAAGLFPLARLVSAAAAGAPPARFPPDRKFVILGASHTSNWDFPVFLGTVNALGRRVRFIGKNSLFRWPMGGFMPRSAAFRSTAALPRTSSPRSSPNSRPMTTSR